MPSPTDWPHGNREHADAGSTLDAYLSRIGRRPPLSREEEKRLAGAARAGCRRSRRRLAESNLRLVVPVAKRFRNRGLAFEDLIQEGNVDLLKAVEKFDPDKNFRFSTYATWWIRQALQRAVANDGRAIRLPVYLGERLNKLRVARAELTVRTGRDPEPSELAELLLLGMELEDVESALAVPAEPTRLDAPAGTDDGSPAKTTVVDLVGERAGETPDRRARRGPPPTPRDRRGPPGDRGRAAQARPGAPLRPRRGHAQDPARGRRRDRHHTRVRPPAPTQGHDLLRRESSHLARLLEYAS